MGKEADRSCRCEGQVSRTHRGPGRPLDQEDDGLSAPDVQPPLPLPDARDGRAGRRRGDREPPAAAPSAAGRPRSCRGQRGSHGPHPGGGSGEEHHHLPRPAAGRHGCQRGFTCECLPRGKARSVCVKVGLGDTLGSFKVFLVVSVMDYCVFNYMEKVRLKIIFINLLDSKQKFMNFERKLPINMGA